jgi:hypothetical protein
MFETLVRLLIFKIKRNCALHVQSQLIFFLHTESLARNKTRSALDVIQTKIYCFKA